LDKPKRYIGMTGFTSGEQVAAVLSTRPDARDPDTREDKYLVMIGVLVSDKSLAKKLLDQPKRYIQPEALGTVFSSERGILNILHINAPREALLDTMLAARGLATHCHGIQVNKSWPDLSIFGHYLKSYPDDKLVLQCGSGALEEAGNSMVTLTRRVMEYEGLATYALIDPSGGRGTPFDERMALQCFGALHRLPFGLAIAGGLSSARLHKLHKLKAFSPFSIDAESGLRSRDDEFVVRFARNYLDIAHTVFAKRIDNDAHADAAAAE
jgi:hypothetical protein